MKRYQTEPGLIQSFRYFALVAVGYFSVLVLYSLYENGTVFAAPAIQSYLNLGNNLILFVWLSVRWFERISGRVYLPVALFMATVVPILSNLVYLVDRNLNLLIEQSWFLFPILVVPLALIAWQYRFRMALIFTVVTAIIELAVLFPFLNGFSVESLKIVGVPLIRAFAFGTVGHIVSHLMDIQKAQHDDLARANQQLRRHTQTQQQLAVSYERNRLARELHDTLAHTLSSEAVSLEALQLMIPPEQGEAHAMLDQSLHDIRAGLTETRRALKDLRSQPLEDLGLTIALRNLAADAARRAQFEISLDLPRSLPDLSPDLEQCVYRISQEALENVVRHASAKTVSLRLWMKERTLNLEVKDDGCGFDLRPQEGAEYFGLRGMRERAAMVNGTLEIQSAADDGTTIHLSVEVNHDPRAAV